jgi:hypothetical protein
MDIDIIGVPLDFGTDKTAWSDCAKMCWGPGSAAARNNAPSPASLLNPG